MRNRTLPSVALVASVLGLPISPAARAQLPLGDPVLVNVVTTGDQEEPAIAMGDDGAFSVLWSDSSGSDIEVLRSKFASDGTPSSPTVLNQFLAGQQRNASVSINASGEFLAAWTSNNQVAGSGKDLFARRTGAGGLVLTGEFQVNASAVYSQTWPGVAPLPDGRFVIVWGNFTPFGTDFKIDARFLLPSALPEVPALGPAALAALAALVLLGGLAVLRGRRFH